MKPNKNFLSTKCHTHTQTGWPTGDGSGESMRMQFSNVSVGASHHHLNRLAGMVIVKGIAPCHCHRHRHCNSKYISQNYVTHSLESHSFEIGQIGIETLNFPHSTVVIRCQWYQNWSRTKHIRTHTNRADWINIMKSPFGCPFTFLVWIFSANGLGVLTPCTYCDFVQHSAQPKNWLVSQNGCVAKQISVYARWKQNNRARDQRAHCLSTAQMNFVFWYKLDAIRFFFPLLAGNMCIYLLCINNRA